MRRLNCVVQRYRWGRQGSESKVAQLKRAEDRNYPVQEDDCYAELWMGTHPNGPSRVMPQEGDWGPNDVEHKGIFLAELLETNPNVLGDLAECGDLPFMFKILSINKALSIQAHPDKRLAERLYATRPDIYKDDNHKPEMAVTLSDFEGLCGFRPLEEIVFFLHMYPELRGMVSLSAVRAVSSMPQDPIQQREALRKLFVSYITAKPEIVASQVNALVQRLSSTAPRDGDLEDSGFSSDSSSLGHTDDEEIDLEDIYGSALDGVRRDKERTEKFLQRLRSENYHVRELMLRLAEEYPGDIGILMPLLLNYLRMGPGQSFFMAANEPHAYLRGDLMEVMARSDNVVRVALTPKYRDVPLLCDTLTYNMGAPPIVRPVLVDAYCQRFTPPIEDFELEELRVPAGHEYIKAALSVPSIFMVMEGSGQAWDGEKVQELWQGVVLFLPAHVPLALRAGEGSGGVLQLSCTHTNTHMAVAAPPAPAPQEMAPFA